MPPLIQNSAYMTVSLKNSQSQNSTIPNNTAYSAYLGVTNIGKICTFYDSVSHIKMIKNSNVKCHVD